MDRRKFLTASAVATAAAFTVTRPGAVQSSPIPLPMMPGSDLPTRQVKAYSNGIFQFSPANTALVVIDMQKNFFLGPNGQYAPTLGPIVPKVKSLLDYARQLGCMIVHTREGYAPDMSDVSDFRRSLGYVGRPTHLGRKLIRGEPGHDFIDELRPLPGETVVDKAGYSSFHGSDLDAVLRKSQTNRLILCGVTTECCVHSTLRDAVDLGYWCLTAGDACAAYDSNVHKATLGLISSSHNLFGWLADTDDIRESGVLG